MSIPDSNSLTSNVQHLELALIRPSALNPRKSFTGIEDLANDIQLFGVQQPITVRYVADNPNFELGGSPYHEIILGERRFRACQLLGLAAIPALVIEASDADVVDRALSENLQREDLAPTEIAKGFAGLLSMNPGLTHEALAARHRVKGGPSRVSNLLRLLSLPELVQAALSEGKLTEGHGVALCSLEGHPEAQIALASRAVEGEGMSVATLREMVKVKRDVIRQAEETVPMPLEETASTPQKTIPPSGGGTGAKTSEEPKPAPGGASELRPKDDNGLTRAESDKQFEQSQEPDPDVPKLADLPAPSPEATGAAQEAPPAPVATAGRVTTTISVDADDWLFEEGITIDEAMERAKSGSSKASHGVELSEMSVKLIKAITDEYNARASASDASSPSEMLEAVLKIRAKSAGIDIDVIAQIPL